MVWAVVGAAFGAASKDPARGAEQGITLFAVAVLIYAWSMYFYLKRQQAKRRKTEAEEGKVLR